MPEEATKTSEPIKTVTEAIKKSPRELTLENALKNAIVVVENLNVLVQRMGMRSLGSQEWVQETKDLLNGRS